MEEKEQKKVKARLGRGRGMVWKQRGARANIEDGIKL